MKKLLACVLAPALVLAFAACGDKRGEEPTAAATHTAVATAAPEPSGETTAPPEPTGLIDTTTAIAAPSGSSAVPSDSIPADTAGIVRYFNDALAKTPMQRISYRRTMTKVTAVVKAIGITILDDQNLHLNDDVMPYVHHEDKTSAPSDLVALEAGWVKDAKSSVDGAVATFTITMKDYALEPGFDPKPGRRGYVSTLDREAVVTQVSEIAMVLAASVIGPKALREVKVLDSAFGQSGGKYTVTVDTATGKIKALAFTGTQSVEGNAKCVLNIPLIPASANAFVTLRGNLEASYAPK